MMDTYLFGFVMGILFLVIIDTGETESNDQPSEEVCEYTNEIKEGSE